MNTATSARYAPTLRWLHWVMVLLIAAAYLLIEQRGVFPRGSDGRAAMMQGRFWMGMAIFVLVWLRLAARFSRAAPPITPPLDVYSAVAAKIMHLALYAFFLVMPLLGLATAWTDGKQVLVPFTRIALPAMLAPNDELAHRLEDIHRSIGEAFYWVIGAHVLAALYHHFLRRDDTLRRML